MEDEKTTQGGAIFETVEAGEQHQNYQDIPPEITHQDYSAPDGLPPPIYEENKKPYVLIAIFVLIFIFIFVLVIRFVLSTRGKKSQKISLTYWGLWEDPTIYQPLIADYVRKNPNVQIVYKKVDYRDYRQKLVARDEKIIDRPDIFRFHNTWVPTIKRVLAPLPKNIMTNQEFEKTFYPVASTDLKMGDSYMGLPLEIDGLVLIYNNELFKKVGLDLPPKSWNELVDSANKLTVIQDGKIITSGMAMGTASNVEHFSDIYGWMLLQSAGNLKKVNGPEAIDALESYVRFAEPPNNVWDENMPNSIAAFTQGKVAMIFAPSWAILQIKAQRPDLDLKVAPLPVLPGAKEVAIASYWVEGVSKYSKNQLEAWKFLKFLVEKENLTKLYEKTSKTRLFGEPYSRVDLGATLVQNQYIGPVIQEASYMRSFPLIARTFDDGINDKIIKYLEDAINSRRSGVSSKEALDTAAKGVAQVFSSYDIE